MNERNSFRDRLLASESTTPALRERYEREVGMLLEKKLSNPMRWGAIAMSVVQLALAGIFAYAFFAADELPILARAGFAAGVLFSLTFLVLLIRVVRKGSMNLRTDPNIMTGLVWVFLVIMITLFMLVAGTMQDQVRGIAMVLNGLVFLIFGVVFMLQNNIMQAHLKTEEKLLEIELRLAEIAERLAK
jgi:hypothetical protein